MKYLIQIFIALSLLSSNSLAQDEDPSLFCTETNACTERMKQITEQYSQGTNTVKDHDVVGFSGSCYHVSSLYNPDYEHHGAFVFEKQKDKLYATGIFSFFYQQDPYQKYNSVELRDWFIEQKSNFSPVENRNNEVVLKFLTPESDYKYWFRTNQVGDKAYMIGQQLHADYLGLIYCDMTRR